MTPVRTEHGFTLIEVLVSMVIMVIVFGATLSVLDLFQNDNRYNNLHNEAQDNARATIDTLARELRNGAAPSSLTPGALEKAGKYSIVFQTIEPTTAALPAGDLNTKNAIRVRYCLNNTVPTNEVLWKQTLKWTTESAPALPTVSTCPDPNVADYEKSIKVAQYIVNRNGRTTAPLFTYIPATWTEVGQITAVEPNIFVDVNPGHPRPGETQLNSSIDLRNENRPPVATFTATELGNRVVALNGTQSTDPDGLALTYKWWDGSEQLSSTSPEAETKTLALNSVHTFKLTVTTPSGLSSSYEIKEMTIT
jgi:prepilin-type N-terminal cleavage/methylation domain-containing protein